MPLKSTKTVSAAAAILLVAAVSAFPQMLRYPTPMPKVPTVWGDATPYDSVLSKTWQGIKKRNINAYSTGMVHRPKSNKPGDAVSEGIAYGMFLALYCNDQTAFNSIWDAGEKYMFQDVSGGYGKGGKYYDWRRGTNGEGIGDSGPASDADQDIALLLIFADRLAESGLWTKGYTSTKGATYAQRARDLLGTIRTTMIESNTLLPGHWGESGGYGSGDTKNPGYFAPAFYRVFAEFDPDNKAAWLALVDGSYDLIKKSPGYSKGLIPDWCRMDGSSTGGAGYNAYFDGDALYRDAIRVYWRLGTDYLWYKEPRAKTFLDNAITFMTGLGGPSKANFFDISGNLLPVDDTEILGDGTSVSIERTRREHSHLTVGMWAAAAIGSGNTALAKSYSDELLKFYQPGTDYWGYAADPGGGTEDTLHNEMYFDQFLAWFGASMLAGVFTNVWDDLKDGVPQGPPEWKTWPAVTPASRDIDASKEPMRLSASFSRSVRWTAEIKHDSTGRAVMFTGSSDSLSVVWYGMDNGDYMPQGFYWVTVSAAGLDDARLRVWLGRPYANVPNLIRSNGRLLVDDFADGDLFPYIGSVWTTYSDASHDNGSTSASLSVTAQGGSRLNMSYTLDRGGFQWEPYVAVEWNCRPSSAGAMDLRGVDTLIFAARRGGTGNDSVGVSVQLIAGNFNIPQEYQFFEDSVYLTAASRLFRLPLNTANFAQRHDGSGKDFQETLSKMIGIRWQIQYDEKSSWAAGSIIIDSILFAGKGVSGLYNVETPPDYIPPSGPISVKHRASKQPGYSIKRSGSAVRITLPRNMAGAGASVINIKGKVVRRDKVSQNGMVDINVRDLAAGMYFVEIRKSGVAPVRVPLGNVK